MKARIVALNVHSDADIVRSRQLAREVAARLGFNLSDQARIATSVSEIARNAVVHGGGGEVAFYIEGRTAPQLLSIETTDRGPGIPAVDAMLEGNEPRLVPALGILSARRLMDVFQIESEQGKGTRVLLQKLMPGTAPLITSRAASQLLQFFAEQKPEDPAAEIAAQNRELVQALTELRERQEELVRLNRELEDTNRGVVALYAELDERADYLRRADEMKSRFLSNMSHEFRTPLNSIMALTQLLLDHADGDLNAEQEKQVRFIRKGAETLYDLVNDLLDLAKIEAGKVDVHPAEFTVVNLFGALRGMLRPLLVSERVALNIAEPTHLPVMYTDEGKVSQILRNFISNAIKFTESGSIDVTARFLPNEEAMEFTVSDTGIGIAEEDRERIFEEFEQVNNRLQRRVKGTGLGLPLCRKLAHLLGGTVSVTSEVGKGSTFYAHIPVNYPLAHPQQSIEVAEEPERVPILVVEDEMEMHLLYDRYLRYSPYQTIAANNLRQARQALALRRPAAIILDILLPGENAWQWMADLKADESLRDIPVILATTVEDIAKGYALGAADYLVKPITRDRLLSALTRVTQEAGAKTALVIDDDEAARYVMRKLLDGRYATLEASDGFTGLKLARDHHPDIIFLDINMPGMSGYVGLNKLQEEESTKDIPVVIITSQTEDHVDRARLSAAHDVLFKDAMSPEQLGAILDRVQLRREGAQGA